MWARSSAWLERSAFNVAGNAVRLLSLAEDTEMSRVRIPPGPLTFKMQY